MDLHIKYRPKNLEEFLGNRGVVGSLLSLLSTNPPHSFMFLGNSGTGKTTLSRIVAKEVGCDISEITEINASDMRGIDAMRDIIKSSKYAPITGKAKAYILDEFHQVTPDGQNALLKVLEDTPPHVYFFICTTNPEKILNTILTRCHKYTLNPLLNREIRHLLEYVIGKEGLTIPDEIRELIIDNSEGIPRTALVLLSTLSGVKKTDEAIELIYKELYDATGIADLCKELIYRKKYWADIMKIIQGMDIKDFEKTRIAMYAYFIGWIKNSKNEKERKNITNIANICALPFNYSTAKYDFILMVSQIYQGVN